MNRLERMELLDRVAKAEAQVKDVLLRMAALEIALGNHVPRETLTLKAKDGNGVASGQRATTT